MFYLRWRQRWYLAFYTEPLDVSRRWDHPWEPDAPRRIEQSFMGTVNPRPFTVMGRTLFGVDASAEVTLSDAAPLTLVAYQMYAHEHQLRAQRPGSRQIDGREPTILRAGASYMGLRWGGLHVPLSWDGVIEIARMPRPLDPGEARVMWRYRFQEAWRLELLDGALIDRAPLPIPQRAPRELPREIERERLAHWNAINTSQRVVEDVWWRLL